MKADYLLWWLKRGGVPAILTTGPAGSQGILGDRGTGVVYGDRRLETRHDDRFNAPAVGPLYGDLAHEARLLNGDLGVAAESLARRITELLELVGLPTSLSACGVSGGILSVLAEEAAQQWTGRFNPRPVTERDLQAIFEAAL